MVYKMGIIDDAVVLPPMPENDRNLILHYLSVLEYEYGRWRDINQEDGGFVLYATGEAASEEVKAYFDYTNAIPECVDRYGNLCSAMYLLNNDYAVVIIIPVEYAPHELINEMND